MSDFLRPGDSSRFYDLPFIGMAVTSPSSKRWLHVNQTLCDFFGYTREALVEKTWAELTHPDDLAADVAEFERVMRGETDGYKMDKRFIRSDGAIIHGSIDVKCERGPDGSVTRFFATVADITQRKLAEAALHESHNLLSNLARQVPGAIYQFRMYPDGRTCFPFASEAIHDIYEVAPEDVREDARIVYQRLHPDDVADVRATIMHSAQTLQRWRCEYRVRLPRQGVRWRSGIANPERLADGSTLWHGFVSDSTAQREAQQQLAESEERYRVLIESAPEAIVVLDADSGRFAEANANALEFFGLDHATLLQKSPVDVSPPTQPDGRPSSEAAMAYIARALEGECPVFEWTHRVRDGRDIPTENRLVRLPSSARRLVRGSITDISEQQRALHDLRLKDQAMATSLTGIAIADATGTLLYTNPAFVRMWGFGSADEVIGRPAGDFIDAATVARIIDTLQRVGTWQGELVTRRVDGSSMDLLISANVVRNRDGAITHLMGSLADITESKRLQMQLVQSHKMQSVGRLAGGVAHDFNNLLTVMKGYLELARQDVPPDSTVAEDLGAVSRAVDSAAGLTQQLLTFSRKQIIHPRVLDLNESVARMHGMLGRVLGEDVELRLVTAPDLGPVRFDPNQAEQLLVNLAVNARDAMPDGGRLTIETANVVLGADFVRSHPDATPGDYVMLAVSDTGTGMSPDVQEQLFEPFFTTKEPGRGTGLGLAMVYGAVTQNGGRIEVYSESGHGTTFRIYLPRVHETADSVAPAAPGARPRGGETIVVVEDDDSIRALTCRLLNGLGYRTHSYRSGAEALRAMTTSRDHVDLVVTDVIMPEMKGSELAERLRQARPGVRILFASGYSEDVIAHHGVLAPGVDFLQKPYSVDDLARRVREVLDRSVADGRA